MKVVNFLQGSDEWHEHRAKFYNASEAPAMLGCSPHLKRDELVKFYATGISKEVGTYVEEVIFARGHEFEAKARAIAEIEIGESLSPVTGTEGNYSASYDGLTFGYDIAWEHKTYNKQMAACVSTDDLPKMYPVQMEQQLMVSGAKKCLFMATKWSKEGELLESVSFWYVSRPELRAEIIAGWKQFAIDVENYTPSKAVVRAEGAVIASLPVPTVQAEGQLTVSNLDKITPIFDTFLGAVNTQLDDHQDFADADATAKECRSIAKKLKVTGKAVISSIVTVSEASATIESYVGKFNSMALMLEKMVKAEREAIKERAILDAKKDVKEFLADLHFQTGVTIEHDPIDFAGILKGVRTDESVYSRINDAVASAKATARSKSEILQARLEFVTEALKGYEHLFNINELIKRDIDHIKLAVSAAITDEDARVAKKIAEEKAKVEAKRVADKEAAVENKRVADEKIEADKLATENKKQQQPVVDNPPVEVSAPAPSAKSGAVKTTKAKRSNDNYPTFTVEQFDTELAQQVEAMSTTRLMAIEGVYDLLANELNNKVLEALTSKEAAA